MKRLIAVLLVTLLLFVSVCFVSCDKKKQDDGKDGSEVTTDKQDDQPAQTPPSTDAGTIDNSENEKPDDNKDGQLIVDEDTEGDQWGAFIPYN